MKLPKLLCDERRFLFQNYLNPEYDFSADKMQDSVGLNLPKILAWKAE